MREEEGIESGATSEGLSSRLCLQPHKPYDNNRITRVSHTEPWDCCCVKAPVEEQAEACVSWKAVTASFVCASYTPMQQQQQQEQEQERKERKERNSN